MEQLLLGVAYSLRFLHYCEGFRHDAFEDVGFLHRAAALAGCALFAAGTAFGEDVPKPATHGRMIILGLAKSANLGDPRVARCLRLAFRGQDPESTVDVTPVERAAFELHVAAVLDAVAICRAALTAFPHEPSLVIANYNATETMSLLVFGLKYGDFPATDEEALQKLRAMAPGTGQGMGDQLAAFFMGSAYEYGVGTDANLAEAVKWYRKGADIGERVSMRELARLLAIGEGVAVDRAEAARLLVAAIKLGDGYERDLLVGSLGASLDQGLRLAIQQELAKLGLLREPPTGTFDAATVAALTALKPDK